MSDGNPCILCYTAIALGVSLVTILFWKREYVKRAVFGFGPDVFLHDSRRPVPTNQKVPEDKGVYVKPDAPTAETLKDLDVDVVLIGGGTSCLVAACLLSKSGYKVAVFEQHGKLGGGCHTFKKKRFEFDVGLHYVGDMTESEEFYQVLDQLTEGQLEWCKMDERFDKVEIGNPDKKDGMQTINVHKGLENWTEKMKEQFPGNEESFDKFAKLLSSYGRLGPLMGLMKLAPSFLINILFTLFPFGPIAQWKHAFKLSADDVFGQVTSKKEVLACLTYIYGTLALPPKYLSAFLSSTVAYHYIKSGGFYPKHGPSMVPYNLVKTITKNGGKCFTRCKAVSLILESNSKGKVECKGVDISIAKSAETVAVRAKYVISSAGFVNTFQKMIPAPVVEKLCPEMHWITKNMEPSVGGISLFIGLNGSSKDLGLSAYNTFMYDSLEFNELFEKWMSETDPWRAVEDLSLPFLYVSFPSAKDSAFEDNVTEPTSTCTVLSFCPYSWFEMWHDEPKGKRGEQYNNLKEAIADKMWKRVLKSFPQLEDKVEVFDIGTPVTNNHYMNANSGEIYGMSHTLQRYSPEFQMKSRFQTEIPGLLVTGQDTWSCGFVPAIATGCLVCMPITKRNYLEDVKKLYKAK